MAAKRVVLALPNTGSYGALSEQIMHAIVGATAPEQGEARMAETLRSSGMALA